MTTIDRFHGHYAFLSNFHPSPLEYRSIVYPTVEHGFQAMKSTSPDDRHRIARLATPGEAKRAGRRLALRPDWDDIRDDVMLHLVSKKFTDHPGLGQLLLATGDAELIEGNTWGDAYWGVCNDIGRNQLGHTLMYVRARLASE